MRGAFLVALWGEVRCGGEGLDTAHSESVTPEAPMF